MGKSKSSSDSPLPGGFHDTPLPLPSHLLYGSGGAGEKLAGGEDGAERRTPRQRPDRFRSSIEARVKSSKDSSTVPSAPSAPAAN